MENKSSVAPLPRPSDYLEMVTENNLVAVVEHKSLLEEDNFDFAIRKNQRCLLLEAKSIDIQALRKKEQTFVDIVECIQQQRTPDLESHKHCMERSPINKCSFCNTISSEIQTTQRLKRTDVAIGQQTYFLGLEISNVCNKQNRCTFDVCSCEYSTQSVLVTQLYRYTSRITFDSLHDILLITYSKNAVLIFVISRNCRTLTVLDITCINYELLIFVIIKSTTEQSLPIIYVLYVTVDLLLKRGIININCYMVQTIQFVESIETVEHLMIELCFCNPRPMCCNQTRPALISNTGEAYFQNDGGKTLQSTLGCADENYQKRNTILDISVAISLENVLRDTRMQLTNIFAVHLIDNIGRINHRNDNQSSKPGIEMDNEKAANMMLTQGIGDSYVVEIPKLNETKWKLHRSMNGFFSDRPSAISLVSSEHRSLEVQHNNSVHNLQISYTKQNPGHYETDTPSKHCDKTQRLDKADVVPLHKLTTLALEHLEIPNDDIIIANVLDPIFQQLTDGSNPGPSDTMKYELLRLCTFRDYPKDNKPYIIKLAASGFYYGANGDEVACYCCGYRRQGWTADCVPMTIHKRISPNCPFLTRNSEVNVPVPDASPATVTKFAFLRELIEEEVHDIGNDYVTAAVPQTPNHRPNTSNNLQQLSNQPLFANNRNDPPKHAYYGLQTRRLDSFSDWPAETCQDPAVLADAGFYFAGVGDCVKCYQCGVGLKHWTHDDDPWIEHSRWTLNNPCPYLIKKKGTEFVELVRMAVEISNTESANIHHENETDLSQDTPTPHDEQMSQGNTNNNNTFGQGQSTVARNNVSTDREAGSKDKTSGKDGGQTNATRTNHGRQRGKRNSSKRSTAQTKGKLLGEHKQLAAENERLRDQTMCKVCFERNVCIVFLPCGHLVTCAECAPTLSACPVCRRDVKGTVKTYMS